MRDEAFRHPREASAPGKELERVGDRDGAIQRVGRANQANGLAAEGSGRRTTSRGLWASRFRGDSKAQNHGSAALVGAVLSRSWRPAALRSSCRGRLWSYSKTCRWPSVVPSVHTNERNALAGFRAYSDPSRRAHEATRGGDAAQTLHARFHHRLWVLSPVISGAC
jgi:hypothetical protein